MNKITICSEEINNSVFILFYFSVALFHDRRSKVDKLATLLCSENFAHYLFVNKGKRLLSKCIPTFNPVIFFFLFYLLIRLIYINIFETN
jgi:hypothetical protein